MHPTAEALAEYARQKIRDRERSLDDKEKRERYIERTLPGRIVDEYFSERNAISQAKERLARYAPELDKEDCPICFVFDGKNTKLTFSFHTALTKVTCSICGFTGNIPRK